VTQKKFFGHLNLCITVKLGLSNKKRPWSREVCPG